MNNRKNIILTKIDLLTISLESLSIFLHKDIKKDSDIHYKLKKSAFQNNYRFIDIFTKIYNIKLIIKNYYIDQIAIDILKEYSIDNQINILYKYNKKFNYIHSIKKEYYKNYKLLKNELNNISMINLYVISQLNKKDGIYILIKYLFK